jgi:hypothetical protein
MTQRYGIDDGGRQTTIIGVIDFPLFAARAVRRASREALPTLEC